MEKYLFYTFLQDKTVYQICQKYWNTKMEFFFKHNHIKSYKSYLITQFANGTNFANGNPIVNYYFSELSKTIRIIQEEPNFDDIQISAWLENFEISENKTVPELVISLQLSPETEQITYDLLSKWLVSNLPTKTMQKYIDLKLEMANLELVTV